jgi:hypothetical protein
MERLLNIGFRKVGSWNQTQTGIAYTLDDCADACNILYAFVCDQKPLYVGKTVQRLRKRMYGYQNPGPTQSTNINGNRSITNLLVSGKQVEIFALPDNGLLHFGVFHINLAAALEDSIVKTLNPAWNKAGTANNQMQAISAGAEKPDL